MSAIYKSPEYTHCIRDARFRHNVYEPEADTFLFLEALDTDAALLRSLAPRSCLEVGCGSGTVITHLRCLLMPTQVGEGEKEGSSGCIADGPTFHAVDVNPLALEATGVTWTDTLHKYFAASALAPHFRSRYDTAVPTMLAAPVVVVVEEVAEKEELLPPSASPAGPSPANTNAASASAVEGGLAVLQACASSPYVLRRFQGDLFTPLRSALGDAGAVFDIILFNPPYVPTSLEELEDAVAKRDVITAAWCGGPRGRVVLDRFLQQLPASLSRRGACYLVLIKENDVADVVACAQEQFRRHLMKEQGTADSSSTAAANKEVVVEVVEVAARYTGEHLSVHRLRYLPQYRTE